MKPAALLIGLCVLSGCEDIEDNNTVKQLQIDTSGLARKLDSLEYKSDGWWADVSLLRQEKAQQSELDKLLVRVEALERGEHSVLVPEKKKCTKKP